MKSILMPLSINNLRYTCLVQSVTQLIDMLKYVQLIIDIESYIYFNTVELYAQNEDTSLSSIVNTIESVYPPSRRKKRSEFPMSLLDPIRQPTFFVELKVHTIGPLTLSLMTYFQTILKQEPKAYKAKHAKLALVASQGQLMTHSYIPTGKLKH